MPQFLTKITTWLSGVTMSVHLFEAEWRICVSKTIIIGSDNGLSPGRRQTIILSNAGILLIGPLGINFGEILIEINIFSPKKRDLKMSSAKWRLFRLGLNETPHVPVQGTIIICSAACLSCNCQDTMYHVMTYLQ